MLLIICGCSVSVWTLVSLYNMLSFLCLYPAAWRAVTWAMTVTRPMPAAYPACPTALHLSLGAMVSLVPVFRRAMPRPPQAVDTRGVRQGPSTRPTLCQLAAPAASAAHLASNSSKGWMSTMRTSNLVTLVTVTFLERACQMTMMTIWPMGKYLNIYISVSMTTGTHTCLVRPFGYLEKVSRKEVLSNSF